LQIHLSFVGAAYSGAMRIRSRWILLGLTLLAARAHGDVTVDVNPVTVERKIFDPAHPPADMPSLHEREAALTQSEFSCGVAVTYQVLSHRQQDGLCHSVLKVRGLAITLQLKLVIWLPNNATPKLSAHEEGHREIAERVYQDAEKAARSITKSLEGKTLAGDAADCEAAEKGAVRAAADQFCHAYLDLTARPASRVGDIYDEITAHGTKKEPAEDEAIRQAFEREKQQ
jgi:hypothetical protein